MKQFNQLPKEVQEKITDTLKCYDKVTVFFENGRYTYGCCLKSEYADDHEYIGTWKKEDIFTEEQMMINYIENFHSYPPKYTGKRDYRMLKEIGNDWSVKFKFENGNLVQA